MPKILVIEDDFHIVSLIEIHLKDLGFESESAGDGKLGLSLALQNPYKLIVLDVMLPGLDGIQICQQLRAQHIHTPILMLTARSEEFDKVLGLESGADDYLTKPFGVREFAARVKAMVRREEIRSKPLTQIEATGIRQFHDMRIDESKRKVVIHDKKIALTPKEYDLLLLLANHPGTFFSREQLLEQVWGYEFSGYEHTVSSHINRLRTKIETDIANPKYILTSWGVGYRFNDEL
jgi:two-component system, OmpR family, alkaline phosphatase synthesis response regulator PhoP